MSASPEFQRIIRLRSLFKPALLPASICGLLSGSLLMILFLTCGALVWLLIETQGSASGDVTLQSLRDSLQGHSFGKIVSSLVPIGASSQRFAAAIIACITICLATRSILRSAASLAVCSYVASAVQRLRQHIHRKSIRLEPADLSGEQARVADRLFQHDSTTLESAASRWGTLWVTDAPDLLFATITALLIDAKVALQVIIPILIGRFLIRMEGNRGDASRRLLSEQVTRGLARMAEGLRKTRIVTSFGMENVEQQQFENHLSEYRQRCRQLNWQQQIAQGNQNALRLILLLVPMSLLVIHVLRGGSPAAAALLCGCAIVVYRSAGHLDRLNSLSTEGSEHADEIATYLNRIPTVSQTPGASFLQPLAKTLTFNQLSFQTAQFPGLIRNLDLRINAGERLALLSLQPTAAYALASMVPRFVDPDLGQVLIDGRDIREATLESLRAESIFIGGHDPVFNASALENITCGQGDITRQQAIEAAKLVHADQFIRTLPKGYDTVLGEHGVALDAGQIFRLSLARAVVRQPALLIIEEPAVSLDQETKALLDDAYQRVCSHRTVVFLPHRLSTVKRCSRIILIHEGRVVVDGVHDQLVKSSELYRHWEYVRFNPFRDETD